MHKAKRAVIMAAGRGSRLDPLTRTVPKPLLPVRGSTFLERAIAVLHESGIEEIHIVVGYLAMAFAPIAARDRRVHLIENPYHSSCNNISSLYVARAHLEDAVILDGDQWIANPMILALQFEHSCYCCTKPQRETREWLLTAPHGRVVSCSRTGGVPGAADWQLWSVSFWTAKDGQKLRRFVEEDFAKEANRDLYWDDIALFLHPDAFSLGIRPVKEGDLMEIDTCAELAAFDPAYQTAAGEQR